MAGGPALSTANAAGDPVPEELTVYFAVNSTTLDDTELARDPTDGESIHHGQHERNL